jgi:hypothetical protein
VLEKLFPDGRVLRSHSVIAVVRHIKTCLNENQSMIFEILVLDPGRKTRCENASSLLFALRSFSKLWRKPELAESELLIRDDGLIVNVVDTAPKQSDESPVRTPARAFLLKLDGQFERIEPLRLLLLEFLEDHKFEHRYITRDEVSQEIACQLYPYLYRVENGLRGYLTRFMTTRFGGTWWKLTASKEMDEKAKMRKKNERVFGPKIDNGSFLIDFDELGELIFEQTSGLLTREDIESRIMQMPEEIDALKNLKNDLKSNYHKFFKTAFADRDFKSKWKTWEQLRNKIAHTNLFTQDDLVEGKKLADELLAILADAEASPEQPTISRIEKEAVQEQIIAKTPEPDLVSAPPPPESISVSGDDDALTDDMFIQELREQEHVYSQRPNGFVGLVRFLRFHLTDLGYTEYEARAMLNRLQRENRIEVYYVENPYDLSARTAALRIVPNNAMHPSRGSTAF